MLDLSRSPLEVAPDLLGATVTANGVTVRLTEVEAYCGEGDPGSHAFRGHTARNHTMFMGPGHLYVYFTYGMHYCMNIVCWPEGRAGGCLLRAGEVIEGEEVARERRPGVVRSRDLARGPANLTKTLAIDRSADGSALLVDGVPVGGGGVVALKAGTEERGRIAQGPRTGVSGIGGDGQLYPWRYWLESDPTVSPYKKGGGSRTRRGASAAVDARDRRLDPS